MFSQENCLPEQSCRIQCWRCSSSSSECIR